MATYEFDTEILGGLPVTIRFTTTGYDNRDVGLGVDDVDEWEIIAVCGRSCKKPPASLYKRINEARHGNRRIIEACHEYKGS